ncbi:MAG: hypothetical protein V4539_22750 [Bacteroidota bacterium]
MQQFKIQKDRFSEIRKQVFYKTGFIVVPAFIATFFFIIRKPGEPEMPIMVWFIIVPLAIVTMLIVLTIVFKRQKALYESYTLTLTDNMITREMLNTPTISIYFNVISQIVKMKNGTFGIIGKDRSDIIGIPAQIENYDQLEEALQKIKIIDNKSSNSISQRYTLLTVLSVGLMICVFTVTDKVIAAVTGILLISLLLWNFYAVRKSKNVDSNTKRRM